MKKIALILIWIISYSLGAQVLTDDFSNASLWNFRQTNANIHFFQANGTLHWNASYDGNVAAIPSGNTIQNARIFRNIGSTISNTASLELDYRITRICSTPEAAIMVFALSNNDTNSYVRGNGSHISTTGQRACTQNSSINFYSSSSYCGINFKRDIAGTGMLTNHPICQQTSDYHFNYPTNLNVNQWYRIRFVKSNNSYLIQVYSDTNYSSIVFQHQFCDTISLSNLNFVQIANHPYAGGGGTTGAISNATYGDRSISEMDNLKIWNVAITNISNFPDINITGSRKLCSTSNQTINLIASSTQPATLRWINPSSNLNAVVINTPGIYQAEANLNGCTNQLDIEVTDTCTSDTSCCGNYLKLSLLDYKSGKTVDTLVCEDNIKVDCAGEYRVSFDYNCNDSCTQLDSIFVYDQNNILHDSKEGDRTNKIVFPSTGMGTFRIVHKVYCGDSLCDTCVINLYSNCCDTCTACNDTCDWHTNGNANIQPWNFIGPTNSEDFRIRTNNAPAVTITNHTPGVDNARLLMQTSIPWSGLGTSSVIGVNSAGNNQRLRITSGSTDPMTDGEGASIDLHGNSTSTKRGELDLVAGSSASDTNQAVNIWTNNGSGQQQSVTVLGNGNVGINQTAPNHKLHVEGNARVTNLPLIMPKDVVVFGADPTNPTINGELRSSQPSTGNTTDYLAGDGSWRALPTIPNGNFWSLTGNNIAATDFLGTNNNQRLIFKTGSANSSSGTERMTLLNNSGNLGIATITPSQRLDVNGHIITNSSLMLHNPGLGVPANSSVGSIYFDMSQTIKHTYPVLSKDGIFGNNNVDHNENYMKIGSYNSEWSCTGDNNAYPSTQTLATFLLKTKEDNKSRGTFFRLLNGYGTSSPKNLINVFNNGNVVIGSSMSYPLPSSVSDKLEVNGTTRIDTIPPKDTLDAIVFASNVGMNPNLNEGQLRRLPVTGNLTHFLRADGQWAPVSSGGGSTYNAGDGIILNGSAFELGRACGATTGAELNSSRELPLNNFNFLFSDGNNLSGNIQRNRIGIGNMNSCNLIAKLQVLRDYDPNNESNEWERIGVLSDIADGNTQGSDAISIAYDGINRSINTMNLGHRIRVTNGISNTGSQIVAGNNFNSNGTGIRINTMGGIAYGLDLNTSGSSSAFGIRSFSVSSAGASTSGYFYADGTPNTLGSSTLAIGNIGVQGIAIADPQNLYTEAGVWGEVSNAGTNDYAVFAHGDLGGTGWNFMASDAKLKKDIVDIDNATKLLLQILPRKYDYANERFPGVHLPTTKENFGFIAQEIEKVFPNLVKEANIPSFDKKSSEKIKLVNYTGIIPIAVAAIKELDQRNQVLESKLAAYDEKFALLEKTIAQLCESGCAGLDNKDSDLPILYQSIPNPTDDVALINYYLPEVSMAQIKLFSQEGKEIQTYRLESKSGKGSVKASLGGLNSGTYIYTLIIENRIIDSKKLQILK